MTKLEFDPKRVGFVLSEDFYGAYDNCYRCFKKLEKDFFIDTINKNALCKECIDKISYASPLFKYGDELHFEKILERK